ncbi:hypothetical protein [Pedobacter sp.]
MIRPRNSQLTEIQYLLLTDESKYFVPFLPPGEIEQGIINFIRHLPKDLIQVGEALTYYELCRRTGVDNPYRFGTIYPKNVESYLKDLPKTIVSLLFVDCKLSELPKVLKILKNNHSDFRYYHFFNIEGTFEWPNGNIVNTPGEFTDLLFRNHDAILSAMGFPKKDIAPYVSLQGKDFFEYPKFLPAQSNYCITNSIVGNFQNEDMEQTYSQEESDRIVRSEFEAAERDKDSFTRLDVIMEQMKKVDYFAWLCYDEKLIKQVHEIDSFFSPLVLVAPFQNPDVKDLINTGDATTPEAEMVNKFKKVLSLEQTQNYITLNKMPDEKLIPLLGTFAKWKSSYLDSVAFLHSSFNFSPIVRLPYQGSSMYRNLSFFRTEATGIISHPRNRRNINKTIRKLGHALTVRTISDRLKEKLIEQNRQIVAITDLPIEWLDVAGVPLSFTHDVCRLPETALNGLMAIFAQNERFQYSVPENILEKTLVIFGSEETAFKFWQPVVNNLSKDLGFQTRVCLSVSDVVKAVDEIKPDLLIFDCHGSVDMATKNSYLIVGNERLTPQDIARHRIHAPLIFLSACNTAPTYGTINTIANAFFGCLSLSVTTTYLPINVNTGAILYIRLLNNLKMAASKPIHKNWLAFVSHIIRTSSISETFNILSKSKGQNLDQSQINNLHAETNTKLLSFYHRRDVYNELDEIIKTTSGKDQQIFTNIVPEYLFYSNLGRSDLILFDSYKSAFKDANKA